jgi:hypothetical protein
MTRSHVLTGSMHGLASGGPDHILSRAVEYCDVFCLRAEEEHSASGFRCAAQQQICDIGIAYNIWAWVDEVKIRLHELKTERRLVHSHKRWQDDGLPSGSKKQRVGP